MKITKSQLRQIIKEEIDKESFSGTQLEEGLAAEELLGLVLAMTGMGAAVVHDNNTKQQIEQALAAANPNDIEKARTELKKYLGQCGFAGHDKVALAKDFLGKR